MKPNIAVTAPHVFPMVATTEILPISNPFVNDKIAVTDTNPVIMRSAIVNNAIFWYVNRKKASKINTMNESKINHKEVLKEPILFDIFAIKKSSTPKLIMLIIPNKIPINKFNLFAQEL